MANHLPMNSEQVARAAEELIAQHGDSALAQADKQIRTCEFEGFGVNGNIFPLSELFRLQNVEELIHAEKNFNPPAASGPSIFDGAE